MPAFLPIYFVCEIVQLFLVPEIGQLAELICSNLGVRLGLIVFNSILLVLTCVYCGSMWKNERKLRNTACRSGCMQDHLGDCDSNNTDTNKEDLDDIWGESAIMRYIRRFLFITLKVLSVSTFLNILVWSWLPEYVPLFSISAMLITLLSVIWMVEYPVLQSVILASILICIFLFFAAKSIERHKTRLLGWLFIYYLIEIFYLFPVPETGRIAELIIPNWGMRLCLTLLNSILLVLTGIYGIGIKESQW